MKKYFAKYLPVEEEMKEGDFGFDHRNVLRTWAELCLDSIIKLKHCKKAVLFLCSKDVTVGDEIIFESRNIWSTDIVTKDNIKIFQTLEGRCKIIGEISKEAIWVKEGDLFFETEIEQGYKVNVTKKFRNGIINEVINLRYLPEPGILQDIVEEWGETEQSGHNYGYILDWDTPTISIIRIKCPYCNVFH